MHTRPCIKAAPTRYPAEIPTPAEHAACDAALFASGTETDFCDDQDRPATLPERYRQGDLSASTG
jgi:hypothetical protein